MNEQDNKRQRRTPEQMVADIEAQLQAAKARAAKAAAKSDPSLAPIQDKIEELRASKRKATVILGSGKQSAAARIASHERWIDKINMERIEAEQVMVEADEQIEQLTEELNTKASELAAD